MLFMTIPRCAIGPPSIQDDITLTATEMVKELVNPPAMPENPTAKKGQKDDEKEITCY